MLRGLKMLSLMCKFVFYRPEHNAKGVKSGSFLYFLLMAAKN